MSGSDEKPTRPLEQVTGEKDVHPEEEGEEEGPLLDSTRRTPRREGRTRRPAPRTRPWRTSDAAVEDEPR
jgi:hypothetical protein